MAKCAVLMLVMAYLHLSDQAYLTPANAATGDYVVELLVVVDPKAQEPYLAENDNNKADADKSILSDIDYFLTEVNKLYANFYLTGIQVSLREVVLLDTHFMASEATDDQIDSETTLDEFDAWLADNNAKEVYGYDHAVFFSGYDFIKTDGDDSVAGLAHVGQICQDTLASSIVEYGGTYLVVGITAHEIGHNLGAEHDSDSSTYVMAPSTSYSGDRWSFSVCTASNVWETLTALGDANCLTTTAATSTTPNTPVTDKLADPNTVCHRTVGDDSYYYFGSLTSLTGYTGTGNPKGDMLCEKIPCIDPDRTTYSSCNDEGSCTGGSFGTSSGYSSDGMVCGVSMACDEGSCVSSTSAAAVAVTNDDCMFGDMEKLSDGLSCEASLAAEGQQAFCTDTDMELQCCETYATSCTAGADACYGDDSAVYAGNSCTANLATHGAGTFCFNPLIFEDGCCVTWPLTCNDDGTAITSKRTLVDQLISKLETMVARDAGEDVVARDVKHTKLHKLPAQEKPEDTAVIEDVTTVAPAVVNDEE